MRPEGREKARKDRGKPCTDRTYPLPVCGDILYRCAGTSSQLYFFMAIACGDILYGCAGTSFTYSGEGWGEGKIRRERMLGGARAISGLKRLYRSTARENRKGRGPPTGATSGWRPRLADSPSRGE